MKRPPKDKKLELLSDDSALSDFSDSSSPVCYANSLDLRPEYRLSLSGYSTLQSPRLKLIPFSRMDVAIFHQLNVDSYIRKFLWDDEVISLELAEEILFKNEQHFTADQFGLWKITLPETNELIGYTGLWFFFDEPQPQLIYALLPAYTRLGFATEAAAIVLEYAFNQLDFSYLIAATDATHISSQQVALRLGMRFVEERLENGKPTFFYRKDKHTVN